MSRTTFLRRFRARCSALTVVDGGSTTAAVERTRPPAANPTALETDDGVMTVKDLDGLLDALETAS